MQGELYVGDIIVYCFIYFANPCFCVFFVFVFVFDADASVDA